MVMKFRQGRKEHQIHPVSLILKRRTNSKKSKKTFSKTLTLLPIIPALWTCRTQILEVGFYIYRSHSQKYCTRNSTYIICLFKLTSEHSLVALLCCFVVGVVFCCCFFFWQRTGKLGVVLSFFQKQRTQLYNPPTQRRSPLYLCKALHFSV